MKFSPQQASAYDKVGAWLKDPHAKQVFYLAGYAGTGKSTLAKALASQADGRVRSAAFTGKAASVLCKKGMPATTIHSMIYSVDDPDQDLIDHLKERISNEAQPSLLNVLKRDLEAAKRPQFSLRPVEALADVSLIVIDECSMVGEQLGQDLCSFGKKILVLGDPAQLPPVDGGGFFTGREPDILLTEIHRQALDNPIISMANMVRQGHRLKRGKYGSSECIDRRTDNRDPFEFDQLIVGLNRTRKSWNSRYRDLAGYLGGAPVAGEKVICLKNNSKVGLLNGTHWRVRDAEDRGHVIAMSLDPWDEVYNPSKDPLLVEAHQFDTDYKELEWYQRSRAEEFDFGYAITCHKSQGSQWDKVFICDESFIFKQHQKNWLYTALTRAAERVVVAI